MYCPDGSCVSQETSTCTTSGPIYTKQTGCRATTQCDVGNRGLIVIGEDDSLFEKQGGVGFNDSVTFTVPRNNPCAINIANPNMLSYSFSTDSSRGFSWYALEMDSIKTSYYGKVNPRNPYITEVSTDYAIFYFGSVTANTQ